MTLRFDSPSEAWLDFVMSNRMNPDFNHDYDLIYGPVAMTVFMLLLHYMRAGYWTFGGVESL